MNYEIIKILENCLRNMNCFSWIKLVLSSKLFQILILKYPITRVSLPPSHLFQISPCPTKTPLQHNPSHVLYWFLYWFLTPFDPTVQLLDISNHMQSQANQIY